MAKISKFKIFSCSLAEDRLDCAFNNPIYDKELELLNSSKYPKEVLSNLGFITDGDHGSPQYVEEGIPYIRAINIQADKLSLDNNLKFISKSYNERIKKSILKEDDILLVTVGATIGKVAIVKNLKEESNISRDLALIRLDKNKILPEYVYYFLMSELGQVQIKHFISGALQDGLYLSNLKNIIIPLPTLKEQREIINKLSNHIEKAEDYLKDYKSILNKIDRYISDKLSLIQRNRKIFLISPESISDRLDCYFYCPELRSIWSNLKKTDSQDILIVQASFLKYGETMTKDFYEKHSKNSFKYLDIGSTNKDFDDIGNYEENILMALPTRARYIAEENDVILPRPIGSNKTILLLGKEFTGQLYSTGFISIKNNSEEEAIILRGVLKSHIVQKQLFYLQSGSIQAEITPSNFKEYVLIPLPQGEFKKRMAKDMKEYYNRLKDYFEKYQEKRASIKRDFVNML